jgi:hypothetical protein
MNLAMGIVGLVSLLILLWAGLVEAVDLMKGDRSYRARVVALRTVRVLDPQTKARWTELVEQGDLIEAIKDLRAVTGLGLKEAENVVAVLSAGARPLRDIPTRTEKRARELFAQGRGVKAIKLIRRRRRWSKRLDSLSAFE